MLKIAIVIPTYKRINKLKRCLDSLYDQTFQNFDIHIYCDNNDTETFNWIQEHVYEKLKKNIYTKGIHRYLNPKQEFVIGGWNKFFKENFTYKGNVKNQYDAVLWVVDDVELYPNAISEAVACLIKTYPDLDGVVGLKQECPGRLDYTFKWYGQCLLGRKFIERYTIEGHGVCCPDYKHFYQDEEMWYYADSLGKFINCETAVLKHYHPGFISSEIDDTHPLVRGIVKKEDDVIYKKRRGLNLIWGKSWELVNEK